MGRIGCNLAQRAATRSTFR